MNIGDDDKQNYIADYLNIFQYPAAIAEQREALLDSRKLLQERQLELTRLYSQIDSEIAFDKSLTNEAQRKARKAEVLQDSTVQGRLEIITQIEHQLKLEEITIARLSDEMTLLKLGVSYRIAIGTGLQEIDLSGRN